MSAAVDHSEAPPGDGDLHGMTDLEEALWGPEGGAVQAAVLHRLDELAGRIRAAVDGGLSPKDYACAKSIQIALAAAHTFMLSRARM